MAASIVQWIDHAVLQPTQSDSDVIAAAELCTKLGTASLCVKPSQVLLAHEQLRGSHVVVSTVVGFPHGGATTEVKVVETELACRQGAREIDMVINLGKLFSGDWHFIERDIQTVVSTASHSGAITKVIFETGLLPTDDVKIRLCQISEAAGAAFVKTSTGYSYVKGLNGELTPTGATGHDVRLMREHCGTAVQVKASGGIRSYEDAAKFIALGATRLGTSSTKEIAAGEWGSQSRTTTDN